MPILDDHAAMPSIMKTLETGHVFPSPWAALASDVASSRVTP
jgi:hypothetical protein